MGPVVEVDFNVSNRAYHLHVKDPTTRKVKKPILWDNINICPVRRRIQHHSILKKKKLQSMLRPTKFETDDVSANIVDTYIRFSDWYIRSQ